MKTVLGTLAFATLLTVTRFANAADTLDPIVGTWKLNPAKSTHSTAVYKSETRTYTAVNDGTSLTWERVTADGKTSTVKTTYKYDGKDYPVTGSSDFDAISAQRIDANTVETTEKLAGKNVGKTRRAVSADGKTMTFNIKFTPADGHEFGAMMVYDRQ